MNQEYIEAKTTQDSKQEYQYHNSEFAEKAWNIMQNILRDLFTKGVEKIQQQAPTIGGICWYFAEKTQLPVLGFRIVALIALVKFFWLTLLSYGACYIWLNPKLKKDIQTKWEPYQNKYFEQ